MIEHKALIVPVLLLIAAICLIVYGLNQLLGPIPQSVERRIVEAKTINEKNAIIDSVSEGGIAFFFLGLLIGFVGVIGCTQCGFK